MQTNLVSQGIIFMLAKARKGKMKLTVSSYHGTNAISVFCCLLTPTNATTKNAQARPVEDQLQSP